MVLRFILQLESSNLDQYNSSYEILHLDYSNLQNKNKFFLYIVFHLEGFLGTLGLQFCWNYGSLTIEMVATLLKRWLTHYWNGGYTIEMKRWLTHY